MYLQRLACGCSLSTHGRINSNKMYCLQNLRSDCRSSMLEIIGFLFASFFQEDGANAGQEEAGCVPFISYCIVSPNIFRWTCVWYLFWMENGTLPRCILLYLVIEYHIQGHMCRGYHFSFVGLMHPIVHPKKQNGCSYVEIGSFTYQDDFLSDSVCPVYRYSSEKSVNMLS